MDLLELRRTVATAIAADDLLVELLVLKGGNALELVYRIGNRASLDLDYSIETDFEDPSDVGHRLERSLVDRFDAIGYLVFDYKFTPRPSNSVPGQRWGGYTASFKLISRERARQLGHELEAMRRQAEVVGGAHQRVFSVEISKYEYCRDRVSATVDAFDCYVYTPAMIAAEKLRAICQQLPSYPHRKHPAPRARDFYDIHAIVERTRLDLAIAEHLELLGNMFAAKDVSLSLLRDIARQREFFRQGWTAVEQVVRERVESFDFYFDFVLSLVERLQVARDP